MSIPSAIRTACGTFIVIAVIAGVLPFIAPSASACSCLAATRKEQAEFADVVFTGVAASVTREETRYVTRFDVIVSYKGKPIRERFIHSTTHSASCGYSFEESAKYTVFAERLSEGKLWTSLCSGNRVGRIRHRRYGLPRGHRF